MDRRESRLIGSIGVLAWDAAAAVVALVALVLCSGCTVRISDTPPANRPSPSPYAPQPCPDGQCPIRPVGPLPGYVREQPAVNLPEELRMKNRNGGSCYWVSLESVAQWQARPDIAAHIRQRYKGGASTSDLTGMAQREDYNFAYCTDGDIRFLEWCCRTRRGAAITFFSNHAITIVGLTESEAWLLDNNRVGSYIRIPRGEFERRWKGYGGDAVTLLVGAPANPLPWL